MDDKPGTRATITLAGRAHIMKRALERPRTQRTELARALQKEFKAQGQDVPEVEVLERMISRFRNHEADDPQDKPWSTAKLDDYPVPPEALAVVLRVWKSRREKRSDLTIREAKWAARFAGLIADTEKLSTTARRYARTELMFELTGNDFDSTTLDHFLMDVQGVAIPLDLRTFLPLLADEEDGFDQVQEVRQGKRNKLRIQETFETIREAQNCIRDVSFEHPDWQAKEVQAEVNRRLGWSDISAVQKPLEELVVELIEPMKEVGKCIRDVLLEHPDWRAKEVNAEVNRRTGWSGLSTVQKALEKVVVKLSSHEGDAP